MTLDIDPSALVADIHAISMTIRALKRELGRRWTRPMADEQRALQRSKQRATELCALRAFARGKLHVTKPPRGAARDWSAPVYHRRIALRLAPSYSSALEQSA